MVTKERLAWLNVSGVPAHAWKEEVFKGVALMFGSFAFLDECTRNKSRLDIGRVCVTTRVPEIINRVIQVKINEVVFSIRIMEDVFRFGGVRINKERNETPT